MGADLTIFSYILSSSVIAAFLAGFLLWKYRSRSHYISVLEEVIDTSENGFLLFDEHSRLRRVNSRAKEFIEGLELEHNSDLKTDDFLNYLYDNALDCDLSLRNAIYQSRENMSSHGFREVIQWRGDRICLVEAIKTRSNLVIFVLRDISELRAREAHMLRLNQSNHELTQAIDVAPGGIIVSDPKQSGNPVIFVNKTLCDFMHAERSEVLERGWESLIEFLGDEGISNKILKALEQNSAMSVQVRVDHDRAFSWFSLEFMPLRNDKNQADLFIGILSDITMLKIKEAEFFESQKLEALGQLSAGVAHDFNNILSIIEGYARIGQNTAENLKEENDHPLVQKILDYMQHIQKATQRGAGLTRQMLTFSRHQVIDNQTMDLGKIIHDQNILLRPLLSENINFYMREALEPLYVRCRQDAIGQILMNLVVNARDAMPGGGLLNIEILKVSAADAPERVREHIEGNEYACISVSDTGTGMDEETRSRIFDPFFTTKEQGKGTGLGMSVVYGLVREMDGYIHVKTKLGQGTTIEVYMPLDVQSRAANTNANDAIGINEGKAGTDLSGVSILLVEDEDELRPLVCGMLEDVGARVFAASNGPDALDMQDQHEGDIDVLLTDIVMPGMNGVKLAKLFLSLRPNTKVVYMSGYPSTGERAPVDIPENALFLTKPIDYQELFSVIKRLTSSGGDGSDVLKGGQLKSARWKK